MKTPYEKYIKQVQHASDRGIPWSMSYEEWLEMWLLSGKWEERGRKSGQYCMCRLGDTGPYSKKNCFIGLTDNNQQERWEDARKVLKEDWIKIYESYQNTGRTQYEVAEMYGVDQSAISKILKKVKEKLND